MASDKKLIVLTGASSGIGLEATKILCQRGHKLVVTVRSEEKGQQCMRSVKADFPDADVHYMICEMTSPKSIERFANEFKSKWLTNGQLLDVLVNNAGTAFISSTRVMCEENPDWEKTIAVNAIAPIYLTNLLINDLKETAAKKGESRVVMVNSSITNKFERFLPYQTDLGDVMLAKSYAGGEQAYKNSKVALMQASLAMAEELEGSGVKLNSLCPGFIPGTGLQTNNTASTAFGRFKQKLTSMMMSALVTKGQSMDKGGMYVVQVADEDQGKSNGLFYYRGKVTQQAPQCADRNKQQKMLNILRDLPVHSN